MDKTLNYINNTNQEQEKFEPLYMYSQENIDKKKWFLSGFIDETVPVFQHS